MPKKSRINEYSDQSLEITDKATIALTMYLKWGLLGFVLEQSHILIPSVKPRWFQIFIAHWLSRERRPSRPLLTLNQVTQGTLEGCLPPSIIGGRWWFMLHTDFMSGMSMWHSPKKLQKPIIEFINLLDCWTFTYGLLKWDCSYRA